MADIGQARTDALIAAIAAGDTVRDAAQRLGIAERSAYRKSATEEFRRRVDELRGEMIGRAVGKLADMTAAAADTLRKLLASKSESVRLGAVRAVCEFGLKLRESAELTRRIEKLERRALRARVVA